MRSFLATMLAGAALLAAGCGGSSSSSSLTANTIPDTAALAPQDAALWISVDTDRSSDQWQALDAVLARIPGAEQLLDQALAKIGSTDKNLDFQRDIQPALGKEVIAVLPSRSSAPIVLVKPTDDAKFKALLQASSKPPVTGEHDGWTVVAQTQEALDAYQAALGKATLADSDAFAQAMGGLPQLALVRVFVNGKGLGPAVNKVAGAASGALQNSPAGKGGVLGLGGSGTLPVDSKALQQIGTIGLSVSAGDHVFRIDGTVETPNGTHAVSFAPTLLDHVPSDAFVAVSLGGDATLAKDLHDSLGQAGNADAVKSVEKLLGVSLDDLAGLVDGQAVLYARPALIIPEISLVLEPKDPAGSLAILDKVLTHLAATTAAKITDTTVGGIALKQVRVSSLAVSWGRDGDRIVFTTAPQAIADFDGSGAKLVATARFKKAAADVELGDQTGGFAYVDVGALAPLLDTIASSGSSGSDPSAKKLIAALSAIDSIAVNSSANGTRTHFEAVVRIR